MVLLSPDKCGGRGGWRDSHDGCCMAAWRPRHGTGDWATATRITARVLPLARWPRRAQWLRLQLSQRHSAGRRLGASMAGGGVAAGARLYGQDAAWPTGGVSSNGSGRHRLPGGTDARHVSVAGGNWQSLRNRDSPTTRITTVSTPPATLDTHAPHAAALCLCLGLGLRLPRRGHAMAAAGRDPPATPSSSE
uniref:Uncharacterized protein n=1 Tax=Oryza sativa subsp. japonica TaxID=39947 RepID=Q6Z3W0_ORYSJ|nr:hypothetical protein [Oryza sativa Japonica Group]